MGHDEMARAIEVLRGHKFVALTGAGCSTESGIPDYRGPKTAERARNPIQYRAFISDAEARRRYWARAVVGWTRFASAQPNEGHRALARLESRGVLSGLITQNVDRLHHLAGSRTVVELHGALHEVQCLECRMIELRDEVQHRLARLNPGFAEQAVELAPDGDAELPLELVERFVPVDCLRCRGPLKPRVVFFGESVPGRVVEAAYGLLEGSDALLVAGSSLAVFSGYRFVRAAHKVGKPVVIVNIGSTRGDGEATVKVEGLLGELLPVLEAAL